MAAASVVLTVNAYPEGVDNTQRRYVLYGTAALTAGDGTSPATGIALNWSKLVSGDTGGTVIGQWGPNTTQPNFVTFYGNSDVAQQYSFNGTSNALLVWVAGAPVDTGILADTIAFKAEWARGI